MAAKNFEIPLKKRKKKVVFIKDILLCVGMFFVIFSKHTTTIVGRNSFIPRLSGLSVGREVDWARFSTILLHRADTSEWTLETTSWSDFAAIWNYINAYHSLYNRKQYVTQEKISTSGHDLHFRSSRPGLERKWTRSIFWCFRTLIILSPHWYFKHKWTENW